MTLLSLSFPRCYGVGHTVAAFRSSRPYFCLYYHPLPQSCDPFCNNRNKRRCLRDQDRRSRRSLVALPPLPLHHHNSHPEAISLLTCYHISSSLPPPLLSLPTPASLLPSRYYRSSQ
ncbi:hypothetical protein BHE74_00016347 [Ensete ventricosum]|nr:hypothetical protein GW17_00008847 [Ensete ventricosum]RWW75617.1 hypothetical protein BHE74_00016347 [Ensete ventricosum]RZR81418.1 hypothetical protein BHM03_00007624 [Ensete ventricosum]